MAAPPPPATTTRTMTALVALPGVRQPAIRPGRTPNLARPVNYEAYLGSRVGAINAQPCSHCRAGNGQWTVCVSVAGFFGGSCTNCHYNSEGARCSLRPGAAARPAAGPAAAASPGVGAFGALLASAIAAAAGPSGSPPRPRRRLSPRALTTVPLGRVAPAPRIVDQVAPGRTFHRRTGMIRRPRMTPSERARRFAELFRELAALYEEEAEVREDEEDEEMMREVDEMEEEQEEEEQEEEEEMEEE